MARGVSFLFFVSEHLHLPSLLFEYFCPTFFLVSNPIHLIEKNYLLPLLPLLPLLLLLLINYNQKLGIHGLGNCGSILLEENFQFTGHSLSPGFLIFGRSLRKCWFGIKLHVLLYDPQRVRNIKYFHGPLFSLPSERVCIDLFLRFRG